MIKIEKDSIISMRKIFVDIRVDTSTVHADHAFNLNTKKPRHFSYIVYDGQVIEKL